MREIHVGIHVGTHTKLYKKNPKITRRDVNPGETSQNIIQSTAVTLQSSVIMLLQLKKIKLSQYTKF